jgi:quinoprotein relay system zinc metallohydrolase 1
MTAKACQTLTMTALLCLSAVQTPLAQTADDRQALQVSALNYQLKPRLLVDGVYVVEGANADFAVTNGCNIINTGFIVGDTGVVVINTGPSRLYGEQLLASIRTITPKPIAAVLNLNLHPDYFLGNQAFATTPILASNVTRTGMAREASMYESNLFRLCGDWMKGTESKLPDTALTPGIRMLGGRSLLLKEYRGHTASDMVVVDEKSGVVFAGGLVFVDRIPTMPHAELPQWQSSLSQLQTDLTQLPVALTWLVPSHGPVRQTPEGIAQTQSHLRWTDTVLAAAAQKGQEMTQVLKTPIPAPFSTWAAADTEFARNVTKLYPGYEAKVWGR